MDQDVGAQRVAPALVAEADRIVQEAFGVRARQLEIGLALIGRSARRLACSSSPPP
jgi:hypothetical protein